MTDLTVTGYHGTSQEAADRMLREGFRASRNEWDCLGDGVYFFEDAPIHAWHWAREQHGSEAAVLQADVQLRDCVDLKDIGWSRFLADVYDPFLAEWKAKGIPLPRQTAETHRLDREVINFAVG